MLALTNERYQMQSIANTEFDECDNAFIKPKKPVVIKLEEHLHRRADFE